MGLIEQPLVLAADGHQLRARAHAVGADFHRPGIHLGGPLQVNILTPPDAMSGSVAVRLNYAGQTSPVFMAQTQALAPSFFVFGGGPYVAAVHGNGTYIGPTTLFPGATTLAKPGETIQLYGNGFGATNSAVQSGSTLQIGGVDTHAGGDDRRDRGEGAIRGIGGAGEFQFNVVVPTGLGNGDQTITATHGGASTQAGTLLTVHN